MGKETQQSHVCDLKMDLDAHLLLPQAKSEHHDDGVLYAKLARWPLYCVATGMVTIVITFSVFFGTGMNRDVPVTSGTFVIPTISRTGGKNPTAPVFTIGLHLAGIQSIVVFFGIFARGEQFARAAPHSSGAAAIRKWNSRCLYTGLMGALGMILTGTFYLSLNPKVHGMCASVLFLCGLAYCLLHRCFLARPFAELSRTEGVGRGGSELTWMAFKSAVCVTALVACVLYTAVLDRIQAADDCDEDNWCPVRNWRSVMEYVLAGSLFLYIGGLTHDLRGAVLRCGSA